ncbi:MAG: bifunctional glutamate N-acetyltransferase/amino-acid acetyltransferase ArgJ [Oligoflexia bacterium]|nr:bifunctional glutamate N-acetyltransferase/amino-acid acetyltransferase ArgJ [Oligoflexia bacterium]
MIPNPPTPGPGLARTPLPKGFTAGGVNCGVRKYRPDLGILVSDREAVAAGVFTTNECKAAPVTYSQALLPSRHIRAIVTNSGQANAATGAEGRENNWKMAISAARWVGCLPHQILTASTGVIGQPLAIDKIVESMPELVERAVDSAENFALAILTTDLLPKTVTTTVQLSQGEARITGICKGSGMIHPNMATMLGYLLTDAALPLELAKSLLVEANAQSFNMISVDGDTSTNDCVFLLANGASGASLATADDYAVFRKALCEVARCLAQSIARDGEGASKLLEIQLTGAPEKELAIRAARGITVSPLIKTAMHGEDPNWGRILARLGAEKVPAHCLERMDLDIQGVRVFSAGRPAPFDRMAVHHLLKKDKIVIEVRLHSGEHHATAWGCDLSKKYVEINTEYS